MSISLLFDLPKWQEQITSGNVHIVIENRLSIPQKRFGIYDKKPQKLLIQVTSDSKPATTSGRHVALATGELWCLLQAGQQQVTRGAKQPS